MAQLDAIQIEICLPSNIVPNTGIKEVGKSGNNWEKLGTYLLNRI